MSKELINEIESKIAWNDTSIDETSISLKDVKRLLNELEEQVECVQELKKENRRYREALKNIYELAEYDEYDNTLEQIVSEIEKVLEGNENEQ